MLATIRCVRKGRYTMMVRAIVGYHAPTDFARAPTGSNKLNIMPSVRGPENRKWRSQGQQHQEPAVLLSSPRQTELPAWLKGYPKQPTVAAQ